ncbi:32588_t:CDS:1, partial [Racocetra persica]
MINDTASLNHLLNFNISEHSNAVEILQYDIVEWIYKNNSRW